MKTRWRIKSYQLYKMISRSKALESDFKNYSKSNRKFVNLVLKKIEKKTNCLFGLKYKNLNLKNPTKFVLQ